MSIRVGFICGKDTDIVEDDKYYKIPGADPSFLADFPDKYRVDPESHEYLMDCEPGTKGYAHCDCALAWWIKKNCPDVAVDIITPEEIDVKRLKSNHMNFTMGYNAVNVCVEKHNPAGAKKMKAFKTCGNLLPTWKVEDFILYKSKYMKACIKAGVPMAPTIFALKGKRSAAQLMKQVKARGWKTFVLKQSESGFSLGFKKLTVEACDADPSILKNYFKDYAHAPEFIVQEAIDGFTRNWETRCFWWGDQFLYAIANMAAVSTGDNVERIVSGDDIPAECLENAKRIGAQAIKNLPPLTTPTGQVVPMTMMRTDIGCSDSPLNDNQTHWDGTKKTFFLNEIEPTSTTYFVRHLKFDCIPMYGKLFADKAREIYKEMEKAKFRVRKPVKTAMKTAMKSTMKTAAKKKVLRRMKVSPKAKKAAPMKAMKAMKAMKTVRKSVMKVMKK